MNTKKKKKTQIYQQQIGEGIWEDKEKRDYLNKDSKEGKWNDTIVQTLISTKIEKQTKE